MGRAPALVWCPNCEAWNNCRSINVSAVHWGIANERQYEQDGICYHQRMRDCLNCGEAFETVELSYNELIALLSDRKALLLARAQLKGVRKALRSREAAEIAP